MATIHCTAVSSRAKSTSFRFMTSPNAFNTLAIVRLGYALGTLDPLFIKTLYNQTITNQ